MPYLQALPDGSLLLRLHVQPRAARNELVGLRGEALKLRLTTPPVDGKANRAALAYLAKVLDVPQSALSIRSGQQNRSKAVLIRSIAEARVRAILTGLIATANP